VYTASLPRQKEARWSSEWPEQSPPPHRALVLSLGSLYADCEKPSLVLMSASSAIGTVSLISFSAATATDW